VFLSLLKFTDSVLIYQLSKSKFSRRKFHGEISREHRETARYHDLSDLKAPKNESHDAQRLTPESQMVLEVARD
jgi:hypothetical protein